MRNLRNRNNRSNANADPNVVADPILEDPPVNVDQEPRNNDQVPEISDNDQEGENESSEGSEFDAEDRNELLHEPRGRMVIPSKITKPCFRCGKANHNHYECKYKEFTCNTCGVKGHLAKTCKKSNGTTALVVQIQKRIRP